MRDSGDDGRATALEMLLQVFRDRKIPDAEHLGSYSRLRPEARARARRRADTVLRHHDSLREILARYVRRRPPVREFLVLMMAAGEILKDGVPPHAAVDGAVRLAGAGGARPGLKKLVNAVLRRVSRDASGLVGLGPNRLAGKLRAEVRHRFGADALKAIEAAHGVPPPLDLTLRDRDPLESWQAALDASVLPTGSVRLKGRVRITALPGYVEGAWWVQDAAAAVAAPALGEVGGRRVLDVCAAPGGKTMQLAAAGARVTAVDISEPRVERLRDNLLRTGLHAEVVRADALNWSPEARFDAILLDAPCTATGTIRRHPELPFIRDLADIGNVVARQAALLDRAARWTRPGGALVYSVCSLIAAECEEQAAAFLSRHDGWVAESPERDLPGIPGDWFAGPGFLQLRPDYWPDEGGLDGFFVARFRRRN